MKRKILLFSTIILLSACNANDDEPDSTIPISSNVFVVSNEGNFATQTAELTIVDLNTNAVVQNGFGVANNGETLGDILQSIVQHNDELYLVLNNSSKIEVVDAETFKRKRTLTGLESPRYMHFTSDEKAYVSDFTAGGIHIINPQTGASLGFIPTDLWIENFASSNGIVWATNPDGNKVFLIDPLTDQIADEIELSSGSIGIGVDSNDDVWVLCPGTFSEPVILPQLYKFNGSTHEQISTYPFTSETGYTATLKMAADGEQVLYFSEGNVYSMSISATELPSESFIESAGANFYGLSINPDNGDIAVTNARDYAQEGEIFIYDASGTLKTTYSTGLIPNSAVWIK